MAKAAKEQREAKSPADRLKDAGMTASRQSITRMDPEDIELVEDLKHPLYDPRVHLPVDHDPKLYTSILKYGVRDPIRVREDGKRDGKLVIQAASGRQRTKILRHINKHRLDTNGKPMDASAFKPRTIPVVFEYGSDADMVMLDLDANNGGIPETPYTRAFKIKKALDLGRTTEEVAAVLGWSTPSYVEKHLAILNMVEDVQKAFDGKEALAITSIDAFAQVPRAEQAALLAQVKTATGGDVAPTTRVIKAAVKAKSEGRELKPEDIKKKRWWGQSRAERLNTVLGTMTGALQKEVSDLSAKLTELRNAFRGESPDATLVEAKIHEAGTAVTQLAAAGAIVSFMLGNEKALEAHPVLKEAVFTTIASGT